MSVTLGNILKPTKTKKMPGLDIYCKNLGSMSGLTIALTDPDAPSRLDPRWSEMCHWIAKLPVAFHENELQLSLDDDGFDELVECMADLERTIKVQANEMQISHLGHHLKRASIAMSSCFWRETIAILPRRKRDSTGEPGKRGMG